MKTQKIDSNHINQNQIRGTLDGPSAIHNGGSYWVEWVDSNTCLSVGPRGMDRAADGAFVPSFTTAMEVVGARVLIPSRVH